jgi:hypothetical protein
MLGAVITVVALALLFALVLKSYLNSKKYSNEIPAEEWNIVALLSVLILPITWIFSISPLLPNVLQTARDKKLLIQIIAFCALIPPFVFPTWFEDSVYGIFGFFVLSGVAFALAQFENLQAGQTVG